MTRTMLEAATASTVPTTRWGVNLQRYMRHATSYECMVKDVQRAQRNARAPVPPIPGNANPTAAEGIDFVLRCLQGMGADCDTLKIEAQTLCLLGDYYEDWVLNTSWRRVSLEPRQAANHGSPSIGAMPFFFFFFLGSSRRSLPFYRFRTNDVLLWHFWAPVCISV